MECIYCGEECLYNAIMEDAHWEYVEDLED